MFSQSEIEILQNLAARRKEIDLREEAALKREVLFQAAEKRLEDLQYMTMSDIIDG